MSERAATDAFHEALVEDDPVQLYEKAPCGYLSTTPAGAIVKANQTFLTWLGYTSEELVGRTFVSLLTAGGRIYHETHYAPMLRMQGHVREIAVDLVRAGGDRLPVLVNATAELDHAGAPRVIRVAVFDATERRDYERELVVQKDRAERSEARALALARTLQQTLIPPALPSVPGLRMAAAYRPAGDGSEVGGDFYDVFEVQGGRWCLVLGDVCGKGVQAAVVTALARYTVRTLAFDGPTVSDVLGCLNAALCRQESERFVTVTLALAEPTDRGWRVRLGVAGHPPPLLVGADGSVTRLNVPGTIVGIFPEAEYGERELTLSPGDTLLLYSDGVTEARGPFGLLGDERLVHAAGELGPAPDPLVRGLVDRVRAHQDGVLSDDVALLAVGVEPRPSP